MRRMRSTSIFLFTLVILIAVGYQWIYPRWKTYKHSDIKVEAKNEFHRDGENDHESKNDHENHSHLEKHLAHREISSESVPNQKLHQ